MAVQVHLIGWDKEHEGREQSLSVAMDTNVATQWPKKGEGGGGRRGREEARKQRADTM